MSEILDKVIEKIANRLYERLTPNQSNEIRAKIVDSYVNHMTGSYETFSSAELEHQKRFSRMIKLRGFDL